MSSTSAIYRSCGNPVLADFVSDLYAYMMEFRRKAVSRPGAILKSHEDHVTIVEGLRRHDPQAVVAAFERHLERIYATTIAIMGRRWPQGPRAQGKGRAPSHESYKSGVKDRPVRS